MMPASVENADAVRLFSARAQEQGLQGAQAKSGEAAPRMI